jgi:DNA replication protein DnaC
MTRFTEKATAITPSRELQPDEYFNETDHLIYCSKCNTLRQCRHELQGKVLIPSIRCKCQQEIFEQEEVQRKLHEKQMEIEHLKTSGLQDKALYDYLNVEDPDVFSHRTWELEYQRKQEMRRNQPARTKKKSYDMEL